MVRGLGLVLVVAFAAAGCGSDRGDGGYCIPDAILPLAVTVPLPIPDVERVHVREGDLAGWTVDCPGEVTQPLPPRELRCLDGQLRVMTPYLPRENEPVRIDFETPVGVRPMNMVVTYTVERPTWCSSITHATAELVAL